MRLFCLKKMRRASIVTMGFGMAQKQRWIAAGVPAGAVAVTVLSTAPRNVTMVIGPMETVAVILAESTPARLPAATFAAVRHQVGM